MRRTSGIFFFLQIRVTKLGFTQNTNQPSTLTLPGWGAALLHPYDRVGCRGLVCGYYDVGAVRRRTVVRITRIGRVDGHRMAPATAAATTAAAPGDSGSQQSERQ